jgi:hypothetical protein
MDQLYHHIAEILRAARRQASQAVNVAMVQAYWQIGRTIVEEEQDGRHRAEYGANMMPYLSEKLTGEFGGGFTERNLYFMKQFYIAFPNLNALRTELSWTHYRSLIRVENQGAR